MSPEPAKQKPGRDEPNKNASARKPRGVGGVLLIMSLLTALFVIVSWSSLEQETSVYDFYRRLFNGQLESLDVSESTIVATYRDGGQPRRMEVPLGEYWKKDADLILDLQARRLDRSTYGGNDGVGKLLRDMQAPEQPLVVKRAFFVSELEGKGERAREDQQRKDLKPLSYVTAIVQRGNDEEYVKAEPSETGTTLAELRQAMVAAHVPIVDRPLSIWSRTLSVREPNTALIYFLGTIGPYLLVILIVWFFIIRQMRAPGAGGGVLSFGRSRAALYTKENRVNVTFDDVAGVDEAKDEMREIIEFLKNPTKFARLGGTIPKGVLLVGPPGTGKTLLAKAIAGEAEVPFFSISGSDFVEMFVGVGASRVRDLFKQARECSPCLIFLDEIDAVGRKRGSGMGGGHDEREQTLNAILVEMDGFDSDRGIILIASTNRPDVLDPALLRPGRFDRQIVIDMPDVKGREAILRVHARKVKMHPNIDLAVVARATPGFSGADLAAVVNEAAILATMNGKEAVELSDLEEARDRVRWGRAKKSRIIEEHDRKVTAYHEAGHALVSIHTPELDPLHKVTIVSRGMALGATLSLPEKDDYHMRRAKLLGMIGMAYGGRAAEELVFVDVSAGAQNDIKQATNLAKMMVCELGMSAVVGPIRYTSDQDYGFLGKEYVISPDLSDETRDLIDREIRAICDAEYKRARQVVEKNRAALDAVAAALLRYETLSGEEVAAVVRGDNLEEFRAAKARRDMVAKPQPGASGQPDIGLAGAQGLQPSS
ncbi:MAG: ATP-dependent zinc metalloprotease FtsH [Planctomycetota bacterium]